MLFFILNLSIPLRFKKHSSHFAQESNKLKKLWYRMLCRLRRLLPTEAKAKVDNSLRDLHNASHHMKAEFIFWGSIPRSSPSLEHFRHSSFYFCTNTFKIPCYAAKRPLWACNEQPIPGQLGLGPHLALIVYKGQIKYFFPEGTEEMAICGRNQNMSGTKIIHYQLQVM